MRRLAELAAWLYHALRHTSTGGARPLAQCLHRYWTACFWGWRYCKSCSAKRAC